jgi:hypothetical protein
MKALEIILFFIAWVSFLGLSYNIQFIQSEKTKLKQRWAAAFLIGLTVALPFHIAVCTMNEPDPVHSKKFSIRTEIKTSSLNGVETERDTIYIFTPKKKN